MKNRGKVNISKLRFVMPGQALKNNFTDPVFTLDDGTPVHNGDTVDFFVDDQIFPTSGTIQNIDGLKVGCFNQILNKWQYFEIIS